MTGPEEYRKATQILDNLNVVGNPTAAQVIAVQIAQARAMLALAAALGTYGIAEETRTPADANAWEYTAGEYTAQKRRAGKDD